MIFGGPIIGGAALIYGAGQLGSYMFTGKTIEENIIPWLVCRLSAVVWHTDRNVYSW